MKKTKFIDINIDLLDNVEYLNKNNLNLDMFYKYFMVKTEVIHSPNYLVFNNGLNLHLFTKSTLADLIIDNDIESFIDTHNVDYYYDGLKNNRLDIDSTMIENIFGSVRSLFIDRDTYSDQYVLDTAFFTSNGIEMFKILNDYDVMSYLDKDNVLSELVETGSEKEILILKVNDIKYIWAYLSAKRLNGKLTVILSIADYNYFATNHKVLYHDYIVPKYLLKNLLSNTMTKEERTLSVDNLTWSNYICHKCKFDVTSDIYDEVRNLIYREEREYTFY